MECFIRYLDTEKWVEKRHAAKFFLTPTSRCLDIKWNIKGLNGQVHMSVVGKDFITLSVVGKSRLTINKTS